LDIEYTVKPRVATRSLFPKVLFRICFTDFPQPQALDISTVDVTEWIADRQRFTESA
jgi:hypothetical protein